MSYAKRRDIGRAGRRVRVLVGALAIVALVAAVVALWQTQSTPPAKRSSCAGTWWEEGAAQAGARDCGQGPALLLRGTPSAAELLIRVNPAVEAGMERPGVLADGLAGARARA
ncbi:hypothetical protein ACFP1Z_01180 [Streptomyces gamaensis]|uniref:Uncharacterized protein n=1 Tax=Streptomyces gamaensis TaxID=1763542 RepID=A0ABW0YQG4_9ACTN